MLAQAVPCVSEPAFSRPMVPVLMPAARPAPRTLLVADWQPDMSQPCPEQRMQPPSSQQLAPEKSNRPASAGTDKLRPAHASLTMSQPGMQQQGHGSGKLHGISRSDDAARQQQEHRHMRRGAIQVHASLSKLADLYCSLQALDVSVLCRKASGQGLAASRSASTRPGACKSRSADPALTVSGWRRRGCVLTPVVLRRHAAPCDPRKQKPFYSELSPDEDSPSPTAEVCSHASACPPHSCQVCQPCYCTYYQHA